MKRKGKSGDWSKCDVVKLRLVRGLAAALRTSCRQESNFKCLSESQELQHSAVLEISM